MPKVSPLTQKGKKQETDNQKREHLRRLVRIYGAENDMTQGEIATRSGITGVNLSYMLNKTESFRACRMENFIEILKTLEVTKEDLEMLLGMKIIDRKEKVGAA
ncbi:MAG: hypothetical protein GX786_07890 [Clostridiales bacterium]|nr:hypothetical protein [Clostridiales bacterium]